MNDVFASSQPTPEEFQRHLNDLMRHLQTPQPSTGDAQAGHDPGAESPAADAASTGLAFDRKPREVKAHLDRFVIQQDEAKKVLSVALCDHYHAVRAALAGKAARATNTPSFRGAGGKLRHHDPRI